MVLTLHSANANPNTAQSPITISKVEIPSGLPFLLCRVTQGGQRRGFTEVGCMEGMWKHAHEWQNSSQHAIICKLVEILLRKGVVWMEYAACHHKAICNK